MADTAANQVAHPTLCRPCKAANWYVLKTSWLSDLHGTGRANPRERHVKMLQVGRHNPKSLLTTGTLQRRWLTANHTKSGWKCIEQSAKRTQTTGRAMKTTLVQAKSNVSTDGDENQDTQDTSNSTVAQGQGKADVWANLSALICVIVAGCKYKVIIIPWLSQKLYQIDFSGHVVLRTGAFAFFTKFMKFKNTCAKFYGRQRLRLTYIDEIPGIEEEDHPSTRENLQSRREKQQSRCGRHQGHVVSSMVQQVEYTLIQS